MSILIEACASEGARVSYLKRGSNPMCDYSLHAVETRPAQVGETLITTTFRGTLTRGFASESEPAVAVCMLPGTELAFAEDVKYDNRSLWTRTTNFRVGKFGARDNHQRIRCRSGNSPDQYVAALHRSRCAELVAVVATDVDPLQSI